MSAASRLWVTSLMCGLSGACGLRAGEVVPVRATVETSPTTPVGDADDVCIWIHPTDPALSTIIGTDKERRKVDHLAHCSP